MTEIEQAESYRLKAENSYLLARLCELEAKLNANLEGLTVTLAQLSKAVMPAGLPRLLTIEQCAEVLQVEPTAVYKWVSEKRIPVRRAGSKPRFLLDEILNWTIPADGKKQAGVVRLARS